jgi:HD superfamily phosphohydrolase
MIRNYRDSLYGDVSLNGPLDDLCRCALIQRLRDIRLSNIDSIDLPGVATITRYEHSLGAAYLASLLTVGRVVSREESVLVQAAALIHDAAITPFGHLFEEALHYVGETFDHEKKWSQLAGYETPEIGGLDLQVYLGRTAGLRAWAEKTFRASADSRLADILDSVRGRGKFGQVIAADFDVDNLDNVTRIAYHMGLAVNRELPILIMRSIASISSAGVVFDDRAVALLKEWLELRESVYTRLMLAPTDFVGKTMLISAFVTACRHGILSAADWSLTDRSIVERLLTCGVVEIVDTVQRWLMRDVWLSSRLMWFEGPLPSFESILEFSNLVSRPNRQIFAYRIKDKRTRTLEIKTIRSGNVLIGRSSQRWVMGVATPRRESFTATVEEGFATAAAVHFGQHFIGFEAAGEVGEASRSLGDPQSFPPVGVRGG